MDFHTEQYEHYRNKHILKQDRKLKTFIASWFIGWGLAIFFGCYCAYLIHSSKPRIEYLEGQIQIKDNQVIELTNKVDSCYNGYLVHFH